MAHLSSKKHWLIISTFLLLVFSFVLKFPGAGQYYTLAELQNTGHFIGFAFLAVALYLVLEKTRYAQNKLVFCGAIAVFLVFLGLTIEFLQGFFGRDSSWRDLSLDTRGALLGLVLMTAYRSRQLFIQLLLYLTALVLLAAGLYKLVITANAEYQAYQAFPLFTDFEQSPLNVFIEDLNRSLTIGTTDEWPGNISQVAMVSFGERTWQGLTVKTAVKDWSNYNHLVLDTYLPSGDKIPLSFEINWTRSEAGFSFKSILENGLNTIRIPLKDIARFADDKAVLSNIIVYDLAVNSDTNDNDRSKGYLFIDNIRLE